MSLLSAVIDHWHFVWIGRSFFQNNYITKYEQVRFCDFVEFKSNGLEKPRVPIKVTPPDGNVKHGKLRLSKLPNPWAAAWHSALSFQRYALDDGFVCINHSMIDWWQLVGFIAPFGSRLQVGNFGLWTSQRSLCVLTLECPYFGLVANMNKLKHFTLTLILDDAVTIVSWSCFLSFLISSFVSWNNESRLSIEMQPYASSEQISRKWLSVLVAELVGVVNASICDISELSLHNSNQVKHLLNGPRTLICFHKHRDLHHNPRP